ncbi:hypothetical protein BC936DRAFT_139382 [Jimgerdemannia flammicorona]|uniref:Uncharacterized protein n=1 Tax=Jimgerdemannia flammicorona TaxID=994334 RepID=A0A433DHR3_9FUNG|nr:hypothetical protein BC936DRAFT_139382 [Jimgerdemannia flammicorona]
MNKLKKAATVLGVVPAFHDSDTESTSTFENEESDDDDLNALREEEGFGKYIALGKSSEKEKAAMDRLTKPATAAFNDSDAESAATFENEESDDEDLDAIKKEAGFGAYTDLDKMTITASPDALLQSERERKAAEMVAEAVKVAEEAENAAAKAKIAESTARAAVARATSAAGPERTPSRAAEAAKIAAQRAAEEATAATNAWGNAAAWLLTANDYLNAIEDAGKNASAYRAEAALEKMKREYHAAALALEEVKLAIDEAKFSADAATNAEHAAVVFSAEAVKAAENAERTAKDLDRKKIAERAIGEAASEATKKQKDKEKAKHDKRVQMENEAAMKWIDEESHRRILFAKWKAEQISDTEFESDLKIGTGGEISTEAPVRYV